MALLFQNSKHGIQLGKETDKCFVCENHYRSRREAMPQGLHLNKEVFLLHLNGLRTCICLNHFKEMLGNYVLLDGSTLSDDEVLELDAEVLEKAKTIEEAKDYTQEQLTKEATANGCKKTKTGKSSKGK